MLAVESPPPRPTNPCIPSPCGPNSQCLVKRDVPSCSCLPEFVGPPPNCRPECISNSECANHLACINQKCKNPCSGSCASNAECHVISHTPHCSCPVGFTGDPNILCSAIVGKSMKFCSDCNSFLCTFKCQLFQNINPSRRVCRARLRLAE